MSAVIIHIVIAIKQTMETVTLRVTQTQRGINHTFLTQCFYSHLFIHQLLYDYCWNLPYTHFAAIDIETDYKSTGNENYDSTHHCNNANDSHTW